MEPCKKFFEQLSKDGTFELVIVNCDKSENQYAQHLKHYHWCKAMPFDAPPTLIEQLEDKCEADLIPKFSIFSVDKGFEKPVVHDIKHKILNKQDVTEAAECVVEKIRQGEEAFDLEIKEGTTSRPLSPNQTQPSAVSAIRNQWPLEILEFPIGT